MPGRAHLLLPLAASMVYVFGALWLRRAADLGVGVWRAMLVGNTVSALVFAPLALLGGPGQPFTRFWQPLVLSGLLLAGQVLGFVSLTRGDVTIATPVLGAKTVIVALFTTLILGLPVPLKVWLAAGLSTGAIALLSRSGARAHRRPLLTVTTGLGAAAVFALFDICVQKWTPAWGVGRLLPWLMITAAGLSLAIAPLVREPILRVPRPAWRPLLVGSACNSVQGILLIGTIAAFGDATPVNVVYSVRSLWMVAVVWAIGHWFHNTERQLGATILGWRLAGALLMTAAVILALAR